MSSNNQLIIRKVKKHKNKLYAVHHHLCVDNEFKPTEANLLKRFRTLVESIRFANKFCCEELVEYGYHIDNNCLEKN